MPLILNGSSLLKNTSGGLATTTACCCGQNPEECFCADPCAYYAEVTSPSVVAVSAASGYQGCLSFKEANSQSELCGIPGFSYRIAGNYYADVSWFFYPNSTVSEGTFTCEAGFLRASVSLDCGRDSSGALVFLASLFYSVGYSVAVYEPFPGDPTPDCSSDAKSGTPGELVDEGGFLISGQSVITLPRECAISPRKLFCNNETSARVLQLNAPLSVTLAHDSGYGAPWQITETFESGNQDLVQEVKDCLKSTPITIVFRKRQSCQPVDCNCGVDLYTMKAVFDGKEFTVGETDEQSAIDGDFEEYWSHYESSYIYYFVYEKWLGPGKQLLYERRAATLFCETDEESIPEVQRWFVEFEMQCRTYDGTFTLTEQTTKTEIGYFNCELGEFCGGLAADQPVPTGSPVEIEEVPSSPETPSGLNSCTPPSRPSLTLSCQ